MKKYVLGMLSIIYSVNAFSADGWTGSSAVTAVDSLSGSSASFVSKVFVSLEGYSNPNCSNNRIALFATDAGKFDQMFSMVLSAMHSRAKVDFYIPDTTNCDSNRVIIKK